MISPRKWRNIYPKNRFLTTVVAYSVVNAGIIDGVVGDEVCLSMSELLEVCRNVAAFN